MGLYHGSSSLYAGRRGIYAGPKRQGGGFSPLQLPGLNVWLDPSVASSVIEVAGEAQRIDDLSGNDNFFSSSVASRYPNYPVTLGGLSAIDNDSTAHFLFSSNLSRTTDTTDTGYLYIVCRPDVVSVAAPCGNSRFSPGVGIRLMVNGDIRFFRTAGSADASMLHSSKYTAGQTLVLGLQWEPLTDAITSVNGLEEVMVGQQDDPTQAAGQRFCYGNPRADIGLVEAFDGALGEMIVGKGSVLTAAERGALNAYLTGKWS